MNNSLASVPPKPPPPPTAAHRACDNLSALCVRVRQALPAARRSLPSVGGLCACASSLLGGHQPAPAGPSASAAPVLASAGVSRRSSTGKALPSELKAAAASRRSSARTSATFTPPAVAICVEGVDYLDLASVRGNAAACKQLRDLLEWQHASETMDFLEAVDDIRRDEAAGGSNLPTLLANLVAQWVGPDAAIPILFAEGTQAKLLNACDAFKQNPQEKLGEHLGNCLDDAENAVKRLIRTALTTLYNQVTVLMATPDADLDREPLHEADETDRLTP